MKKIIPKSFTFLLLLCLFSCGGNEEPSSSDKIMQFAENLVAIIDEFEDVRVKVLKTITDLAPKIDSYFTSGQDEDLSQTANRWEKDWKVMADEIAGLEKSFKEIETSSIQYFQQLEKITDGINNDELREQEFKKNEILYDNWTKAYNRADEDMEAIRNILNEGNDFHKVLLTSAMRAKVGDNIQQLKGISAKARKIIRDLGRFPVIGKQILRGNFADLNKEDNSNTQENDTAKEEEEETNTDAEDVVAEVKSVSASSFLSADGFIYRPENVSDNKLETWWTPKEKELNQAWIRLDLDQETTINGISIHGGSHYKDFPNYGDLYNLNLRVKTAELLFSDGSRTNVNLEDIDRIQTINFDPVKTRYVELKVTSTYASEKWNDLCISHLDVVQ